MENHNQNPYINTEYLEKNERFALKQCYENMVDFLVQENYQISSKIVSYISQTEIYINTLKNHTRNATHLEDKVFKRGLSKFFKGCLPQNSLSPLLNTLSHLTMVPQGKSCLQSWPKYFETF